MQNTTQGSPGNSGPVSGRTRSKMIKKPLKFRDLPEDLQKLICKKLFSSSVLSGRALTDARNLLNLKGIAAVSECFGEVTCIDDRSPVVGCYAYRPVALRQDNLLFILSCTKRLRELRITSIYAYLFLKYLPVGLEVLEFYDHPKADLRHVLRTLKTLVVHNPLSPTVQKIYQHGDNIESISFVQARSTVTVAIEVLLAARRYQYSSISLILHSTCDSESEERRTEGTFKRILDMLFSQSVSARLKLCNLHMGPFQPHPAADLNDIEQFVPSHFFNRVNIRFDYFSGDPSFCDRSRYPRRMNFGPMEMTDMAWTPSKAHFVEEVILFDFTYAKNHTIPREHILNLYLYGEEHMLDNLKVIPKDQFLVESIQKIPNLKRFLVRVPFVDALWDQIFLTMMVSWYLDIAKRPLMLEIPRDFTLMPINIGMNEEFKWWEPFQYVKTLVLTNGALSISFLGEERASLLYNNDFFLSILPTFIDFLRLACSRLQVVYLEFAGQLPESSDLDTIQERKRHIGEALAAIDQFEKDNCKIDIGTIRSQVEFWEEGMTM